MNEFEFLCPNRILVTHDLAKSLKDVSAYLGVRKALVITDQGLAALNIYANFKKAMAEAGFDFKEFTGVHPNPTNISIIQAADALSKSDCDVVIGFGGGSSIDTAKLAAMMKTNGGILSDYYGENKVKVAPLPIIAIPTTAGSGADITKFTSLTDLEQMTKVQISDPSIAPRVSIIYAENLLGTPLHLIPAVGFDSLTHAVEGYLNRKANPITEALSLKAFELMSKDLVNFYNDNTDVDTAAALLLATSIGCMACSSIGTGDAHSIARSVGGHFTNIHHGTALAVVLPHVLNFNLEIRSKKMAELAKAMGLNTADLTEIQAAQQFVLAIQKIRDDLSMPSSYKELGMTTDCLEELAEASKYKSENGSSADAAPRKATIEEYQNLIMDAYEGKLIQY